MKKVYYYCTCNKNGHSTKSTTIREVEVNEDGACKSCGYYAVASPIKVSSRHELFRLLKIDGKDEENIYVGASVVDTVKERLEGKDRRKKINQSIL